MTQVTMLFFLGESLAHRFAKFLVRSAGVRLNGAAKPCELLEQIDRIRLLEAFRQRLRINLFAVEKRRQHFRVVRSHGPNHPHCVACSRPPRAAGSEVLSSATVRATRAT